MIKQKNQRYERNKRQKQNSIGREIQWILNPSAFMFNMIIYFTPKEDREPTDFISIIQRIDLNSMTFGQGSADPPLYPKH